MTRVEVLSCVAVCFFSALAAVLLIKFLGLSEGFSLLVLMLGVSIGVLFGCEVDRRARLRQGERARW
jgi:hypothetical protein